ncbi:PEP-CTERM sorting domain-containing protein [Aestuariibacter sp. A3R04]|uniref:PEP-CTERM sorting domain-containing protein n=1 Tax=Aestuariibacter sp. A3R04 TaxID=2841571 RepID=UPI001C0882F8|nr:PEP-CTERM sorting domain-containing protein [Aestuariibacter sp. A3R04]MBU3023269.1 PEP-CTERM sorting domain-containing protein [Aestuariibacter sp. A3R04]
MQVIGKIAVFISALIISTRLIAAPIFSEDFESDLSQWPINGSGQIVADILSAGNNVLRFNSLGSGGDAFTATNLAAGTYYLSLDMLGTCQSGVCGGFAGVNSPGEQWLIGDGTYPASLTVLNNGQWQHFEVAFTVNDTFNFKLEDFRDSGIAGDVYFDNICISSQSNDASCPNAKVSVPEPSIFALLGMGFLGLRLTRRK